jgi:hypothetical protein
VDPETRGRKKTELAFNATNMSNDGVVSQRLYNKKNEVIKKYKMFFIMF